MYKHIIYIDNNNNIIDIDSIVDSQSTPIGAIEFEQSEEEYFNPPSENGNWGAWSKGDTLWVPIYHYEANTNTISRRDQKDIDADLATAPQPPLPEPTLLDRIESQVTYTAIMTDTLIEEEE